MLYFTTLNGEKKEVQIEDSPTGGYRMRIDREKWFDVDCEFLADGLYLSLLIGGKSFTVETRRSERPGMWIARYGSDYQEVIVRDDLEERAASRVEQEKAKGPMVLKSPMPGVVIKVNVAVGDEVEEGETIAIVEAMKMQNELAAEHPGRITEIHVSSGEALEARAPIATIAPLEEDS